MEMIIIYRHLHGISDTQQEKINVHSANYKSVSRCMSMKLDALETQ